ncbi:MAG: 2-oxoacid:acceptor oxidoreductase family protein [Candidatus Acetothermia bacterium]|jgi:pyruvate ferredoxin oxidoreductase gamma subunit|nr:2-oxoacid:acceptor oxidoreductase family protein [Candidatus Acetothermia bacterium]MDH7504671.1 2-oxoacid:acceptor oxidoreductase family protein [Candidatus Acetothermia bacterium]
MLEIRWHARGGQGAKTVSQLLALAALARGNYVQAFPEYGPERSGAPVKAFNRIDDKKIRVHYNIYEPDVVVVVDDSLLNSETVKVTEGLKPEGILLVNTKISPAEVRRKTNFKGKIFTIDAEKIAESSGVGYANIPTLGALARAVDFPLEPLAEELKKMLGKKAPPEKVQANLAALQEGYERLSANGG